MRDMGALMSGFATDVCADGSERRMFHVDFLPFVASNSVLLLLDPSFLLMQQ